MSAVRLIRSHLAVSVACLLLMTASAQLVRVRLATGQWAVTEAYARAPIRVELRGRTYRKGDRTDLPGDAVARGRTPGGGVIYASGADRFQPVVIFIDDHRIVWAYALSGGP